METDMKINKEQMMKLAAKSDAELWAEILAIAKSHGYDLQQAPPKSEELERIRRALRGAEKITLSEAARIMNSYKKRG